MEKEIINIIRLLKSADESNWQLAYSLLAQPYNRHILDKMWKEISCNESSDFMDIHIPWSSTGGSGTVSSFMREQQESFDLTSTNKDSISMVRIMVIALLYTHINHLSLRKNLSPEIIDAFSKYQISPSRYFVEGNPVLFNSNVKNGIYQTVPHNIAKLGNIDRIMFRKSLLKTIGKNIGDLNTSYIEVVDNGHPIDIDPYLFNHTKCAVFSDCSINSILESDADEYPNITALNFCNCNLRLIPDVVRKFSNLEFLHLRGNNISEFPQWLSELKRLHFIDLNGNAAFESNIKYAKKLVSIIPLAHIKWSNKWGVTNVESYWSHGKFGGFAEKYN